LSAWLRGKRIESLPSDQILGFWTEMDVVREEKVIPPIDDLSVYIMRVLRTKWGIA
jgi:hypothetical protein